MNVLTEWLDMYFDEIEPRDFYREIFPLGELDEDGAFTKGKYVGVIIEVTDKKRSLNNGKERPVVKRYSITDDLYIIDEVLKSGNFCLTAPISYAGKERGADNARFLYAIAVDVDDIIVKKDGTPQGLIDLWNAHIERVERVPKPTMIVSSGTGIHLYYVFEKAIPLFPNVAKQLQKYKHELTRLIWNEGIVNIKTDDDIQYEGIYQGFRMPGTITKAGKKDGTNERARAFVTGHKVTIEYMNQFVNDEYKVTEFAYKSSLPLADAKEKYPEWYERRVENKEKGILNPWHVSRRLYDWWKGQILSGAKVRHRYWCLWVLAVYAKKCSFYDEKHNPNPVTREELERDAWELMEHLESLTDSEDNHFTEVDVIEALEAFEDSYISYPKNSIRYKSAIPFEAQVRRNGRKQVIHLERARAVQAVDYPKGEWRKGNGRPTAEQIVQEWQLNHPNGKKADCIRETGLSKPTVYKWWLTADELNEKRLDEERQEIEREISSTLFWE